MHFFSAIQLNIVKAPALFNKSLCRAIEKKTKKNILTLWLTLISPLRTKNQTPLIHFVFPHQPLATSSATAACRAWRTRSTTPEATTPRTCARPASATITTATSAPTATGSGTTERRERWGQCARRRRDWRRDPRFIKYLEQPAQQGPGMNSRMLSSTSNISAIMTDNDSVRACSHSTMTVTNETAFGLWLSALKVGIKLLWRNFSAQQ